MHRLDPVGGGLESVGLGEPVHLKDRAGKPGRQLFELPRRPQAVVLPLRGGGPRATGRGRAAPDSSPNGVAAVLAPIPCVWALATLAISASARLLRGQRATPSAASSALLSPLPVTTGPPPSG